MNWSSAMYGGIIILATIYYVIWGRKQYTPPEETIEDYILNKPGSNVEEEKSIVVESVEIGKKDM
jgi:hypothetical protein